jgi:hypothetical protein
VIGQGIGGASDTSLRLLARSEVKPGYSGPPEHGLVSLARADAEPRAIRGRPDPAPNAPLLIRLVQYPYRQELAHPRRTSQDVTRGVEPRPALETRAPLVPEAREARERPLSGPPALPRPAAPPRPGRYPGDPR